MNTDGSSSYITIKDNEIENRTFLIGDYMNFLNNNVHDGAQEDCIRFFGAYHLYRGNTFSNWKDTDDGGAIAAGSHIDVFQTYGSSIGDTHDILIDDNVINSSCFAQIAMMETLSGLVYDIRFTNNIVMRDAVHAFPIGVNTKAEGGHTPVGSIQAINNTFIKIGDGQGLQALRFVGGTGHVAKNNIFYRTGNYTFESSAIGEADYNLSYGSDWPTNTHEPHGFWQTDPLFVDPVNNNYHLSSSSPAINAGVLDSNTPPNDKDENLRNVGVPDIGAYEYGATEGTDDLPPSVSILSPSNNATVSNNVDISSSASDNINIMKVEFLIDDSLVSTQTVRGQDSNYGFSWDSRTVSNANHTLKAKAYDTSNNTNEASITINVNNLSCNGLSSVSQIANKLNPKTNTNSADNWNWWNNIIPKDQSCTTMFFQEVAPTDNTIYSMLWDRVVPEFWANQFYYKYLFDHAIPEKLSNSYYYTRFWNKAVSEYWTNGFYYKRLWDKAVPENWVSSSPDSYRTTFYTKAVPLNWSSSYYSSRLWNKAVPELWSNQHYYTYLFNTAIPSNLASDYYYNYFWNTAVPTLQANSFYYTRLWNKAIPENWVPESGSPGTYSYKWTFWIKAVPLNWSSSFYQSRFWNKAVPELWVSSYYKNTLNNEAKVGNWAGGYYAGR